MSKLVKNHTTRDTGTLWKKSRGYAKRGRGREMQCPPQQVIINRFGIREKSLESSYGRESKEFPSNRFADSTVHLECCAEDHGCKNIMSN
jgi:hypothetical protein